MNAHLRGWGAGECQNPTTSTAKAIKALCGGAGAAEKKDCIAALNDSALKIIYKSCAGNPVTMT